MSIAVALALITAPAGTAEAQFLYLDTNGDALSSSADVLKPTGEPTTVAVYLDTAHNADSSAAFCITGPEPLTINSYEIILHASGGTVTYGNFANLQDTMGTSLGNQSNETEFYVGFGGGTALPSGLYQLGTLSVTIQSGSPSLHPASAMPLGGPYETAFGTQCASQDQDNTHKLGLDWFGIAGCGPPGGGSAAPAGAVPTTIEAVAGEPTLIIGEFVDANETETLQVTVQGLAPGLVLVDGLQRDGRKQVRFYGAPEPTTPAGSEFAVSWQVSNASDSQSYNSTIHVDPPLQSGTQFEDEVTRFYTVEYFHGLPSLKARGFGLRSLPILARLLRDPAAKRQWHQIAAGIGLVGDPAYFDTLRSFIWERFHGPVDLRTFMALMQAQSSLGPMAPLSPGVRGYLEMTAQANAWEDLPWSRPPNTQASIATHMRRRAITAISYTDSDWAANLLTTFSLEAQDPEIAETISIGREVNGRIRLRGLVQVWAEQDRRR